MKKNRLVKIAFALLLSAGLLVGLAACGGDDAPAANPTTEPAPATDIAAPADTNAAPEVDDEPAADEAPAETDVYQDLQDARAVVSENLTWGDNVWEQIMLADDVPSPEMKYGLLVVPFFPSDLTGRHTRTVDVNNGNFVIEITSADTGIIWSIDQDGNINQVG